jgi:hypothetical protein
MVPLHDARRALALAGANDVDVFDLVEQFNGDRVAGLLFGSVLEADLGEVLLGTDAALAVWPISGKLLNFRPDVAEPDLDGVVAVGLGVLTWVMLFWSH